MNTRLISDHAEAGAGKALAVIRNCLMDSEVRDAWEAFAEVFRDVLAGFADEQEHERRRLLALPSNKGSD